MLKLSLKIMFKYHFQNKNTGMEKSWVPCMRFGDQW